MESFGFEQLCCNTVLDESCLAHTAEETGKYCSFTMLFRVIKVELVFRRMVMGQIPSVLCLRVYPNKNTDTYYFLPEIFTELGIDEYRACFFAGIDSRDMLSNCLQQLWRVFSAHKTIIEKAVEYGQLPWNRQVSKADTYEHQLIFSDLSPTFRDDPVIIAYTNRPAYKALLLGETNKAIELYNKDIDKNRLFEYEKRLCHFLQSNSSDGWTVMPPECNTVLTEKVDNRQIRLAYIKSGLLCYLAFALLFVIAAIAFNAVFSTGCEAYFAAPWYFGLLLAFLPAFFGAAAFRKKLFRIVSSRSDRLLAIDGIKNGKFYDVIARAAFILFTGFSVIIFCMILLYGIRIYTDRFDAAPGEWPFHRETYAYEDIIRVYHISARHNDDGDCINRSSYVVLMKDGRWFDFDGSSEEEDFERSLIPLIEPYNIDIVEADSDYDIGY